MEHNPFDDPEFRAQMERMGVKHSPGMADELLKELAPLMRADGVDLDRPEDLDLDTLNAALSSAVERRNMELFTPVGVHRDTALATLRVFSEALANGDDRLAQSIIGSVEPDPTPDSPSVAHVISAAVETVATWHADPSFARAIPRTRVPKWARKPSRETATDVLALAPKGRAMAAIDSLVLRHGGLSVLEGAALAVAGLLIARAKTDDTSVAALGAELLGSASPPPKRPSPAGSSFRRPAENAQETALDAFADWLYEQADVAEEIVDDEIDAFDEIIGRSESAGLDVRVAAHIPTLLERFDDDLRDDPILLNTLDHYVHFRIESGADPAGWAAAHDAVEALIVDGDAMVHAIAAALERREDIPPAERGATLNGTRLIRATSELLAWIGDGRRITETGLPRRDDIKVIAGMFGVDAHGSAKRVPGDPTAVRSLLDLPTVTTWWDALAALGIVEILATRVRPGPRSTDWLPTTSLDACEALVVAYVGLTLRLPDHADPVEQGARNYVTARLTAALQSIADDLPAGEAPIIAAPGRRLLARLNSAGIVTLGDDGDLHIPDAIHPLVARGIILAADLDRGEV